AGGAARGGAGHRAGGAGRHRGRAGCTHPLAARVRRTVRWRSPQGRLLLSGALLAGLVLTAIARQQGWGGSGVWIAVACLAGAGWLWKQGSLGRPGTPEEIPLEVRARTGLSPRCGLALIE